MYGDRLHDGDYDDKLHVRMPPPRSAEDTAKALANLRAYAQDQPDPEAWYHEMVEILGLDEAGQRSLREFREPCWPNGGTRRGYIIHLNTYTSMCDLCQPVQDAERAADRRKEGEPA